MKPPLAAYAVLALFALVASSSAAAAQGCPFTPAVGDPERKAIMDALRGPVEAELGQQVRFVAETFNVCGGWAFLEASPQRPDERPVDWTITPYREAVEDGVCGGYVHALLVKENGGWHVREHVICASDVPWVDWSGQFGAPRELFPRLD